MAFGAMDKTGESSPMAEINMIPLIDVMLVLLVIFIITAPLLAHSVRIDLPKASSEPVQKKRETVQLGIRASGEMYWNGQAVDKAEIALRMAATARFEPQPEVHLHADRATPYEKVAQVMSAAANAGLVKIGFVTEPTAER